MRAILRGFQIPARSYGQVTMGAAHLPPVPVSWEGEDLWSEFEAERWTWRCMQCSNLILADGRCGCWWRRRPMWVQAIVLSFTKPRYGMDP